MRSVCAIKRRAVLSFLLMVMAYPWIAAAGDICRYDTAWDHSCLRQHYAAPIERWPAPRIEGEGNWQEMAPVSLAAGKPEPEAKRKLGERLFFDPALSASGRISCASCHQPQHAFADTLPITPGHEGRKGRRNAPALIGVGLATSLFWDGRAASLEQQAAGPIADPAEMAMSLAELPAKLEAVAGYLEDFRQAYGESQVTLERIQTALAAYQRTLIPEKTRFDAFLEGQRNALDAQELLGLHLFRTKARCMTCHHGPALNDNQFHNLGLTYFGRKYEDLGRYHVTGKPEDSGKFRTPTLRNVSRSGPWMHNGLFRSLRGILNLYNAGMPRPKPASTEQTADPRFPVTSNLLKPLQLNEEEIRALEAFLKIL